MKQLRFVPVLGLVVTLACQAMLFPSFLTGFGLRPDFAYLGEVWGTEGSKLTVRDGKLQQEGSGGGGLAIYREELPRLRTFSYLLLVISSVFGWLLLLRQQRLSNSAKDVKARSVMADTNAPQKISPTSRTSGTGVTGPPPLPSAQEPSRRPQAGQKPL
jgi:hypothetical protein